MELNDFLRATLESQLKIKQAKLKSLNNSYASYANIAQPLRQACIAEIEEIENQLAGLKN